MADNLANSLREYLKSVQGRVVTLRDLRMELKIDPNSSAWEGVRVQMLRFANNPKERLVVPSGKNDGVYKVIVQVNPVRVFVPGRERRPVFNLMFPQDAQRDIEIDIADKIVIREGDLITLGGVKSKGKTTLCLQFAGANIDKRPVLMGNEYTVAVDGRYEPAPRFFNRLEKMSEWIEWVDSEGNDKFTLLPVREDYAEHIVRDKINIIDWINMDAGALYDISRVLENIKAQLGRGVAIIALQKSEGAGNPRGGQFVRDFSDVEILLDGYGKGDDDILMTIKGVKEKKSPVVNKTFAYTIINEGTQLYNFREVVECRACRGSGYTKGGKCEECNGRKYIDKDEGF